MARMSTQPRDVTIIGGGIVGLATAYALTAERRDDNTPIRVTVLEKESHWAAHQTGRNSGVIHSGLYYRPGSTKAHFARSGAEAMYEFCSEHGLPVERCGKVVVATDENQLPQLRELGRRATANGVAATKLSATELKQREPHVRGVEALHVPDAGIVDFAAVARCLVDVLRERGVEMWTSAEFIKSHVDGSELVVTTTAGDFRTRRAVNCAGLHSDRVAELAGYSPPARILPFRGEYYDSPRRDLVSSLVYPVPDPAFPFLGVHFTRTIHGGLHVGPNAVPALAREGYDWRTWSRQHLGWLLRDSGLRTLAKSYWKTGAGEIIRSLLKPAFVRAARQLVPDLRAQDLVRAEAGVRAQAIKPDGTLVDDFLVLDDEHWVHVLNAPSPAATASLLIGRDIAGRVTTSK